MTTWNYRVMQFLYNHVFPVYLGPLFDLEIDYYPRSWRLVWRERWQGVWRDGSVGGVYLTQIGPVAFWSGG